MKTQRAVRDERWKLIAYPELGHLQLFDLRADPHEITNLVDRPEHAARGRAPAGADARLAGARRRHGGDSRHEPQPPPIDLTGMPRQTDQWQPDWIVKKYFGRYDLTPSRVGISCDGP